MADYDPWGSDYYVIRSDLFPTNTETDGDGDVEADEPQTSEDSAGQRIAPLGMLVSLFVVAFAMV